MRVKPFVIAFFTCVTLTLFTNTTFGCSCLATPSVIEEFEESDVVVIVRILSVDKVDQAQAEKEGFHYVDGVRSTTARIEKVYKGNIRVRDEIVFAQGGGADCVWTFNEEHIGEQTLFYLRTPQRGPLWYGSVCGRSRGLKRAKEDLLYLDNMKKRRGLTRVSGELGEWNAETFNVSNKKIRIVGEKKTYETKTDENGIYEIYDLPPGQYRLEPEIQKGWRIARHWLRYVSGIAEEQNSTKSVTFKLEAKKHVSINVSFEPDNAVEGRIVDELGNPINNVCAYLWTPEQTESFGHSDCTNENGEFRIESIMAGSYNLVVNPFGATSKHSFPRFFYPNVTQREKAALISIADGEVVKNINLVAPKALEIVTLSGVVLFSDGNPVADSYVTFKVVPPVEGIRGDMSERSDADGRFTFKVIKGLKGEISTTFYASVGMYEDCPKLDAIVEASGEKFYSVKTVMAGIDATQDMDNLVLRLPFPKCKRKPR